MAGDQWRGRVAALASRLDGGKRSIEVAPAQRQPNDPPAHQHRFGNDTNDGPSGAWGNSPMAVSEESMVKTSGK